MKFTRYSTVGPSELLKKSGKNISVPKSGGDYHVNLTHHTNYVKPGPQDYKLPGLFDNYNSGKDIPMVKKNPRHEFGIKHTHARILSKDLLTDNFGLESPGVGHYLAIKDRTFE